MASRTAFIMDKGRESYLEALVSGLFRGFEREGIEYALARDYGHLPLSLDNRDLDILVGKGQLERAYQVVVSAARSQSSTVLRINQESAMWLLVIHPELLWGLRVDLAVPNSHTWRGVTYLRLDRAFRRKTWESGICRMQAHDIVFMQFSRDIIGTFELRERYRSAITRTCLNNPRSFEMELEEIFGGRCASRLLEVCRNRNFENLKSLGKQMRRAVIARALSRAPLRTAGKILRYLGWRCREYMRPNGVTVAVIGPDGAGKGTLTETVSRYLSGQLHFSTVVYHWRPGLLPSLRGLLLGQKDDDGPVTNPHAKESSGLILSLLRLAYYTVDYVIGYWLLVRPYLGRKCIATIFDRYYYDYLIDPARYRISLPPWIVKALGMIVPRPNLVILLTADPEEIHNRKPELPLIEIQRQASEMDRFVKYMGNCVYVNSCGPIEDSAQNMSQAILSVLGDHLR